MGSCGCGAVWVTFTQGWANYFDPADWVEICILEAKRAEASRDYGNIFCVPVCPEILSKFHVGFYEIVAGERTTQWLTPLTRHLIWVQIPVRNLTNAN